ncbi:uncharacterized protein F4807DRAFT_460960 [Annulohypoxylon truncatum]|uniref:uncharacterized protein n=1 Tax=Annulohypoxylon truncatum TaxID=327061 RepID=UPI0020086FAF|nr:uncharacterized protein F4807DRAFT_460960 [Annulohypoxylon truncatum]KAI1209269.1 hypothetical protein F4807DRAFT_460960 [Annulohypoxylon truncatum]
MQFHLLFLSLLAAIAMAEDNLTELVDDFPDCALPCFASSVSANNCKTTDFNCICGKQVDINIKMGGCLSDNCQNASSLNVGGKLDDLCDRWDDHPNSTEVAAATSALASHVTVAVTAASSTSAPEGAAGCLEPGIVMVGAVAAAMLVI